MNILFLCVANSARSQIAHGLARHHFSDKFHFESAGSLPSGKVHPFAIEVLKQIDLDISGHRSKGIDQLPKEFLANIDYVITLCEEEACPTTLNDAKKLHWPVTDPASESNELKAFENARDTILKKLFQFKKNIEKIERR